MTSHKIVFVAPTAAQLDEGDGSLLRWKVHRYLASTGNKPAEMPAPSTSARHAHAQAPKRSAQEAELGHVSRIRLPVPRVALVPPTDDAELGAHSQPLLPIPQPNYSSPPPSYELEQAEAALGREKENQTSSSVRCKDAPDTRLDIGSMGRARPVGISRTGPSRPPILKSIRNKRLALAAAKESAASAVLMSRSTQKDLQDEQQSLRPDGAPHIPRRPSYSITDRSITAGGLTTIESIPPPPPHNFALSSMTTLADVLAAPEKWLSEAQGGTDARGTQHFNTLAVVTRIGALDKVKNWKSGNEGSLTDRCEIVVRDESGCSLRVNLEDACAMQWTGPKDVAEMERSTMAMSRYLDQSASRSRPPMLAQYSYESAAVQSPEIGTSRAFESYSSSLLDTSTLYEERMLAMLPIKAGDVVALSNLRLVRSRPRQTSGAASWRHARRSAGGQRTSVQHPPENDNIDVFAVAVPVHNSTLELCWRNAVSSTSDLDRNFDPDLVAFNARCRAIYRLASSWQT